MEGGHEEVGLHIPVAFTALTHVPLLERVMPQPFATPSRSAGKEFMMPSEQVSLSALKTLLTGLAMSASPRWHEDRL
jgi:hypothetical protein